MWHNLLILFEQPPDVAYSTVYDTHGTQLPITAKRLLNHCSYSTEQSVVGCLCLYKCHIAYLLVSPFQTIGAIAWSGAIVMGGTDV